MFRNIYRKKPQETAQNEFPPIFFQVPGSPAKLEKPSSRSIRKRFSSFRTSGPGGEISTDPTGRML